MKGMNFAFKLSASLVLNKTYYLTKDVLPENTSPVFITIDSEIMAYQQ